MSEIQLYTDGSEGGGGILPAAGGEYAPITHRPIEEIRADEEFRKSYINEFFKQGDYKDGADFGKAGGVDKMVFLSAIMKIMRDFHIGEGKPSIQQDIEDIVIQSTTIRHYHITIMTPITNLKTNQVIAWAIGSCSTMEDKYRYRGEERKCPSCGEMTIKKGMDKYGGGWYCDKKKGGCGAKYGDYDERITAQIAGRTENLNPRSVYDTVLFMAQKRGIVKKVLYHTGFEKHLKPPKELMDNGEQHHADHEYKQRRGQSSAPPPNGNPPTQTQEPPTTSNGKGGERKQQIAKPEDGYKAALWRTLAEKHSSDNEAINAHLVRLTEFKNQKGEPVSGTSDIDGMKEIRAKIAYEKLIRELESGSNG